jgi:hypothetical protein
MRPPLYYALALNVYSYELLTLPSPCTPGWTAISLVSYYVEDYGTGQATAQPWFFGQKAQ